VAQAGRLKKRAMREKDRRFLVEGVQSVGEAVASGAQVHEIFHTDPDARVEPVLRSAASRGVPLRPVSQEVMAHLTSTVTPQGLVAVAGFVDVSADQALDRDGFVPVLVEVRDPGNAGTILRSADAAGVDAVVFTRSSVDVYNPKTVRATAGSLFHVPVVRESTVEDAVAGLRSRGFAVLAADAGGKDPMYDVDLTGPTAVLFGNEAKGLPPEAVRLADRTVRVPIAGRAESLNLAAAATLFMFEAARQRGGAGRTEPSAEAVPAEGGVLADLVAGAAHDIRSPLTSIRGFASTLASRWDLLNDEQRKVMLEGITYDGLRMQVMITQLVDAARLSAGRVELRALPVDLLEAARKLAEDLARFEGNEGDELTVSGRSVTALADPDRLRTILHAMVESARWWGEHGPVQIKVGDGGHPMITVARDGTSLDPDQAAALFLPRAPGSGGGSKVGLFVARGLAEEHDGSLDAEVQDGIRFVLRLPASRAS